MLEMQQPQRAHKATTGNLSTQNIELSNRNC